MEQKKESYRDGQVAVREAIAEVEATFGKTFGLRAFPGKRFRLNHEACYYSSDGGVQLVTDVERNGEWLNFARGGIAEVVAEAVWQKPSGLTR